MPRVGTYLLFVTCLIVLALTSCGSGNRQLESITISPGGNISMQYTAIGTFNKEPTTVSPLPVGWYVINPSVQPLVVLHDYPYTLTTQPLTLNPCVLTDIVVALAPTNPSAPSSGTVPSNVYQDLVITRVVSMEGGFVAATAPANCST